MSTFVLNSFLGSVVPSECWDITNMSFNQSFSIASYDSTSTKLFFNPDGTKMFVLGAITKKVFEFTLSTAWRIHTATKTNEFTLTGLITNPYGLFFGDNGTRMFICGSGGTGGIEPYTLSGSWDISSPTLGAKAYNNTLDIFFKADGTILYYMTSGTNNLVQVHLGTAWDMTSVTSTQHYNIGAPSNHRSFYIRNDGEMLYTTREVGATTSFITQSPLNTPWDITKKGGDTVVEVTSQEPRTWGTHLKEDDGTKLYTIGLNNDNVNEYDLVC